MKSIYVFLFPLLVITDSVASFVLEPAHHYHHPVTHILRMTEKTLGDDNTQSLLREQAHHQWKEEAAHLHALEHAVETDPDLAGLMNAESSHKVNMHRVEQEAHKHDSLLSEIQHSIEHDPDLANIVVDHAKKAYDIHNININRDFMEQEAHVHDSLLNEVCHAVDMDPDLSK